MSVEISSFLDKTSVAGATRQAIKSGKENHRGGLKPATESNPSVNKVIPDSLEIDSFSSLVFSANRKVDYKISQVNDEMVIRIVDSESGEVVRQIPGKDFIRLTQRISEFNKKILNKEA